MAAIGRALMSNPRAAAVRRDQPRPGADRHPRHLRRDAAHQTERHQHRTGRAGHRAGDEGRRSGLLLSGGPGVAVGPPSGTYPRTDSPRLFRTLSMLDWLGTIIQGVLLGGSVCAVRRRPVADLRHHAAGQSRPWRSDRAGGVRDPLAGDVARRSIPSSRSCWQCRRCSPPALRLQHVLLNRTLGTRSAAAAAGHIRVVHHHSERLARGVYRRQPAAAARRDRDRFDRARRQPGDRRDAAAHARLRDRGDRCCSICCSIAPHLAGPFARPPTISKSRS